MGMFPTTYYRYTRGNMATRFITHLLGSEECADMLTLRFSRPEGFDPVAGQYVLLELEGHRPKPFTCASAPSDPI